MLRLTKYCANGNDFLLLNAYKTDLSNPSALSSLSRILCDRHSGFGADGFVVLLPTTERGCAYRWEFYNADGSSAKMCGNASRCVGSFAFTEGIAGAEHRFLSGSGQISVNIDLANPLLVESGIGICKFLDSIKEQSIWGTEWFLVDSGVPHLLCFYPKLFSLESLTNLENLARLKELRDKYNANVSIAFIYDRVTLYYATFERGVENITLACGTAAGALLAQAYALGLTESSVACIPPSRQNLQVRIDSRNSLYLKGEVLRIGMCELDNALLEKSLENILLSQGLV